MKQTLLCSSIVQGGGKGRVIEKHFHLADKANSLSGISKTQSGICGGGTPLNPKIALGSQLALIGNVLSFAIAIAAGLYLNPEALKYFGTLKPD
jgi:hypothetical protein